MPHGEIREDGSGPLLGSVQPWAGPLGLAGTVRAAQGVGAHAMAADLGALCRAGSSRKGGPFISGVAGVTGRGSSGGVSGCGTLGLPILEGGLA